MHKIGKLSNKNEDKQEDKEASLEVLPVATADDI